MWDDTYKLVSNKPDARPPVSELQLLCPGHSLITVDVEPDAVLGLVSDTNK